MTALVWLLLAALFLGVVLPVAPLALGASLALAALGLREWLRA